MSYIKGEKFSESFCIKLQTGETVYRITVNDCPDCNGDYESSYYTDELGNPIPDPDLTNATNCQQPDIEGDILCDVVPTAWRGEVLNILPSTTPDFTYIINGNPVNTGLPFSPANFATISSILEAELGSSSVVMQANGVNYDLLIGDFTNSVQIDFDIVSVGVTYNGDITVRTLGSTTQFRRKYFNNPDGTFGHNDFELDGETPYTVINEDNVGLCEADLSRVEELLEFQGQDLMCDKVNEEGIIYNITNVGGGVFEISRVNLYSATSDPIIQITTSDLNGMGYDAVSRILYAINRNTGELWAIDLAVVQATNLGVVTGLPTLPTNLNYGDYNNREAALYVGGSNEFIYKIDTQNLTSTQISVFQLGSGSGDMAFTECGELYVSIDGVITRYQNMNQQVPDAVTTIPDNGSGFSGSFGYQDGLLIGLYGDNIVWTYNLLENTTYTGTTPISGSASYDFAISPTLSLSLIHI